MILKVNEWRIPLPEPMEPFSIRLSFWSHGGTRRNPGSYLVNVIQVDPGRIAAAKERPLGTPCMFAILQEVDGYELLLYPTPDRELEAILSFFPPRREI